MQQQQHFKANLFSLFAAKSEDGRADTLVPESKAPVTQKGHISVEMRKPRPERIRDPLGTSVPPVV